MDQVDTAWEICKELVSEGLQLWRAKKRRRKSFETVLVEEDESVDETSCPSMADLQSMAEDVFVKSRSERGKEFQQASEDALDFLKKYVSVEDAVVILKEVLWKWSGKVVYAVHRRDGK